ncbi:MAG: ABC transporter substrate-binding protein [Chloroflexi bacterium]|nr:ABC transporter substrate-binding protein [Chloroflexota bacterium]
MVSQSRGVNRLVLLVALVTALLAAVGVSAQDAVPFRVGMIAPTVLDPALHTNDPETMLNRAIYDYLVEVLPDSTIGSNLAESWTISDDGLTYTFTLREGVTFHDGSAFDSADVVWTYNRLKDVGSPALNLLGSEFTVEAPDASTVVFTIPAVNADFLYGVGALQALIIPDGQSTPNELGEGDATLANFNGTGPFILTGFEPGARATFAANPNYWMEGAPGITGMEHIYIDDPVAQVDNLLSGSLDFITKVSVDQIDRLASAEGVTVIEQVTSQHPVIRLRTDAGSLGENVAVRQAFKYATDRDLINELITQGRGVVGNNDPIAPVFSAFYDDTVENQSYDPAEACRVLEEAGIGRVSSTLYYPLDFGYEPLLAQTLQQLWAEGCIDVDLQEIPVNLYYDVSNPENYFDVELGITGWGARPSPQLLLQEAYLESGIATYFNESRFVDPELEALVAEARANADTEARKAIYSQVSQIFLDRGPIIIPFFAPLIGAQSDRVQGLEMAPFPGRTDFRTVTLSS